MANSLLLAAHCFGSVYFSDVQGRMFDLSWGVCKTNGGNGVQGGYVGLSWGVFTTEKVMSRVGCLICPWGGGGGGGGGV